MRTALAILFLAVLLTLTYRAHADNSVESAAQPDGSIVFRLTPEQVKQCGDNGGCRILNANEMRAWAAEIIAETRKTCGVGI